MISFIYLVKYNISTNQLQTNLAIPNWAATSCEKSPGFGFFIPPVVDHHVFRHMVSCRVTLNQLIEFMLVTNSVPLNQSSVSIGILIFILVGGIHWYTYPSEKWWSESQLGWWQSQMNGKSQSIHVPKHQPAHTLVIVKYQVPMIRSP